MDTNPEGTPKTNIRAILRYIFLVLISAIDFADAILDIVVSVLGLLNTSCGETGNPRARKWALILFCNTIAGRILGGVCGIFYERIMESRRLSMYIMVELTILWMEDVAALTYVAVKGDWTELEYANFILTMICAGMFFVSTLSNYKYISPIVLIMFTGLMFGFGWLCYMISRSFQINGPMPINFEFGLSVAYPFCIALQLCVLYCWCKQMVSQWEPIRKEMEKIRRPEIRRSLGVSGAAA